MSLHLRLADIICGPSREIFIVSYILRDEKANFVIKKRVQLTREELLAFFNRDVLNPMLICYQETKDDFGLYSFIDKHGKVHRQRKRFRAIGRYFLKQFFDEAIHHSIEGTGEFKVSSIPYDDYDSSHVVNGWISHYFTRANELLKSTSATSLHEIGVRLKGKRDHVSDEHGNALPIYQFDLNCSLCLVRPKED